MNSTLKTLIGLMVCAGFTGLAAARGSDAGRAGPFLLADAGVAFVQDVPLSLSAILGVPVSGAVGSARFDPGFRLSLGPGYASPVYEVAFQLETGFIHNNLHSIQLVGTRFSGNGELWEVPLLADILYHSNLGRRVAISAGVGFGAVYHSLGVDTLQGIPVNSSSNGADPAFQAMAGLFYRFNQRNELGLGYKFLAFFPGQINVGGDDFVVDHVLSHTVSVAYVLRF